MLPLEGIKVIELAQNRAGPFCAQILAHLGADGGHRLMPAARDMEMSLALPVQALLAEVAVAAFEHGHQQVTLLFAVECGDLGHGTRVGRN